ncbi:MAG: hypothetical protein RL392_2653 [Pseudomonadota bacterium]|jgi:tetratricopeptide (TPR) repeat protein
MSAGYVYILINPAMPGLAKVGKTTRTSKERQLELSSATGVPSPFILAYEHPVANCHAAESWVHAELDRRGYRASASREFFTAPLHEIVSVVVMGATTQGAVGEQTEQSVASVDGGELADELSRLADSYRDGTDDVLRSPRRALELYEQAAKLGDSYSCEQAANLLRVGGDGVRPDFAKALEYLKRSLSLSPEHNWHLSGEIAKLYSEAGQAVSTLPYWGKFAERLDSQTSSYQAAALWRYCFDVVHSGISHDIPDSTIGLFGPLLIGEVNRALMLENIDTGSAERTKAFIVDCVGKSL